MSGTAAPLTTTTVAATKGVAFVLFCWVQIPVETEAQKVGVSRASLAGLGQAKIN